jgi:hypothetical protein
MASSSMWKLWLLIANSVSPGLSFLKHVRSILLTESVDRFEVIVGAVPSAAILDGEIDVEHYLCSR